MGRDHRKIEAYQLAKDLVVLIYRSTGKFPNEEKFGLTSQMRRAAVSVPANIAEGAARRTKKDYLQFLYVAKGSLAELECFLDLSVRLGYLGEAGYEELEGARQRAAGKLYRLAEAVALEV